MLFPHADLPVPFLRCADRGHWHEQHLLSSAAFSCCCRSHGRWHIANLLFMSSTLLHLIALLFAVQAGAWKACTCIPCATCSASETACLVPVCCFCLHCCSCLLDSPQGLPKSCPTGSLLVLGVPRPRRLGLPGYFSSLFSHSLPLGKFQARTRLRVVASLSCCIALKKLPCELT